MTSNVSSPERFVVVDVVTKISSVFQIKDGVLVRVSGIVDIPSNLRPEVYDAIAVGSFPTQVRDFSVDVYNKNTYASA